MAVERLYLAGLLGVAMYGAFFAALLARPVYGGLLYDDNGYLPFKAPVGPGRVGRQRHGLQHHVGDS